MQLALRPYATTGIALIGASAIAITPLAAPKIETQVETQIHHAAVQLAAMANPLAAYEQTFQDTIKSLQGILTTASANGPAPVATAVLNNQLAALQDLYGLIFPSAGGAVSLASLTQVLADQPDAQGTLLAALHTALGGVVTALTTTVPPLLQSAADDLGNANVEGAINNALLAVVTAVFPVTGLIGPALDAIADPLQGVVTTVDSFGPLATIAANPLQNVVNVLKALNEPFLGLPGSPSNAVAIVGGLLGPVIQVPGASGAAVQSIINAAGAGDLPGAFQAALDSPAVVLNGVLNGKYGPDLQTVIPSPLPGFPIFAGGLLNPFGLVPPGVPPTTLGSSSAAPSPHCKPCRASSPVRSSRPRCLRLRRPSSSTPRRLR